MASTYQIVISDLKVGILKDGDINTYARDKYRASFINDTIKLTKISTETVVLQFDKVSFIKKITDYRNGGVVDIPVPTSLRKLYVNVFEEQYTPFFFEQFKAGSSGPVPITGDVEVTNTVDISTSTPLDVNISKNELGYDAWGRAKAIKDNSIFHGMFTYNVPITTWYETVNGVVGATTNCTSVDGSLNVTAGATLNDDTYLRSYRNPRYEPNRGALYSTAGWITNPTALMTREWGTFTAESGVFFRLKSGGTLVGVIRTTTTASGTVDTEYALTIPTGVDLSKGNIFDIQYQWRGVGDYKWLINNELAANSNTLGTLTQLSMFNPALPVAWNSVNLGDNDPMNFGCCDVTSEGGKDNGKTYGSVGIDNTSGQVSISGTGNFNIPVIAVRSKPTVGGLINTRDTLALLASAYADQRAFIRVWATRDFTVITDNSDIWNDFGDGHLEHIELSNGGGTDMTFNTTGLTPIFGARVGIDSTYATSALFEGRTEIYLTPGDMFIFTMHRETGAAVNIGVTFEFAEAI